MTLYVDGEWKGWDGSTVVKLSDSSVWKQEEYFYEYNYAYRPKAELSGGKLQVARHEQGDPGTPSVIDRS
ncbi:hypothetical protein [Nocardia niigatensis]|uniref:hypothetical protein n=1 Tax=Nocardia niigatensis TaxID=209249 RepID=UPI0002E9ED94|nr:hypothetical protein [Nocardia niigatensis]